MRPQLDLAKTTDFLRPCGDVADRPGQLPHSGWTELGPALRLVTAALYPMTHQRRAASISRTEFTYARFGSSFSGERELLQLLSGSEWFPKWNSTFVGARSNGLLVEPAVVTNDFACTSGQVVGGAVVVGPVTDFVTNDPVGFFGVALGVKDGRKVEP